MTLKWENSQAKFSTLLHLTVSCHIILFLLVNFNPIEFIPDFLPVLK